MANEEGGEETPKPEASASEPKAAEPKSAEKAIADAVEALSADGDAAKRAADELAKKMPDQLLNLFATMLAQAKVKQDAAAASAASNAAPVAAPEPVAAEPAVPREATEFEKQLQGSVKRALEGYVSEKVVADQQITSEINVDAEFLKQHGPGMLASALQGFAKAIVPEELKLDLDKPTATTDQGAQDGDAAPPSEKQQVSLKLDLGGMIQGFFANLAKGPQKPPPA
jgi:hypothetical protein